ncbi:unnamed protein product [Didymodactylos carnosus]|uniref:Uncharacterized protein n=1 Tax=Didymodactylos carnosus TaxID=1234261 RepID=A0A815D978_9BILA|nr:unnamed protein product [Didymodactylos carnosus]CAF1426868.1 unnamed protein product [Didymodactylos carnosus]CAF4105021.1 unnamed protein product [Didymodactylos carnosus]CAF4225833.1 unnamed protein product [Didymodactylos carnosus]
MIRGGFAKASGQFDEFFHVPSQLRTLIIPNIEKIDYFFDKYHLRADEFENLRSLTLWNVNENYMRSAQFADQLSRFKHLEKLTVRKENGQTLQTYTCCSGEKMNLEVIRTVIYYWFKK